MQIKKFAFVGANIEVGQALAGLSLSAPFFLRYLNQSRKPIPFDIDAKLNVSSELSTTQKKCFNINDLNNFDFSAYESLSGINHHLLYQNKIPCNFGGDHSVAISTVEASLSRDLSTHVIWIDAHADANCAEQSNTGSLHGMPLYYLLMKPCDRPQSLSWLKNTLQPDQLTYIGIRDIDPFELKLLHDLRIDYFTAEEIRSIGIEKVLQYIQVKNKRFNRIHLSFDIDSLDPNYSLCTGVPSQGGLKLDDVMKVFRLIQQSGKLANFDFVEINPKLASCADELEQIYSLAYQLIQTVLMPEVDQKNYYPEDGHAFISN